MPAEAKLRVSVTGPDFDDAEVMIDTTIIVPLGPAGDGATRLEASGLLVMIEDGKAKMEEPLPGSPFDELGKSYDFYADAPVEITTTAVPRERLPKEIFYIPAFLVLGLVLLIQRRRRALAAA